MVTCMSVLQLVSHVIKNAGDRLKKKLRTELQKVVGLGQILAGNVITVVSR